MSVQDKNGKTFFSSSLWAGSLMSHRRPRQKNDSKITAWKPRTLQNKGWTQKRGKFNRNPILKK